MILISKRELISVKPIPQVFRCMSQAKLQSAEISTISKDLPILEVSIHTMKLILSTLLRTENIKATITLNKII